MVTRLIRVPDVPVLPADVRAVRAASQQFGHLAEVMGRATSSLGQNWRTLEESYETGHTAEAVAQILPVEEGARHVAAAFADIQDALDGLANGLDSLKDRAVGLVVEVRDFHVDVARELGTVLASGALVARNAALWAARQEQDREITNVLDICNARLLTVPLPPGVPTACPVPDDWWPWGGGGFESPALLGYLGDGLFWALREYFDRELPPEAQAMLDRIAREAGEVDEDTAALERAWILWGLDHGGELYTDPNGGPCGRTMVCVIGDLPTGQDRNAITLGRSAVFDSDDDETLDMWWQMHEYAHVVDQVDVGANAFLQDYAVEALFTTVIGEDSHDGNILEQACNLRANYAMQLNKDGEDWRDAFETSAYEADYERVEGSILEWGLEDLVTRGGIDNDERMEWLRDAMDIPNDIGWEHS